MSRLNFHYDRSDGAKWGVGDFYDDFEAELVRALREEIVFDTGWYSVKKEIQSAHIWRVGGRLHVEVSVSNDFDEEATMDGHLVLPEFFQNPEAIDEAAIDSVLTALKAELDKTLAAAEEMRDGQSGIRMFIIGQDQGPGMFPWQYTFLLDTSLHGADVPSGDNYHRWGWQEVETDDDQDASAFPTEMPRETADKIKAAVLEDDLPDEGIAIDGWRVRLAK